MNGRIKASSNLLWRAIGSVVLHPCEPLVRMMFKKAKAPLD
jgi:hypothetical protein